MTHGISFLPQVDKIIVLVKGQVSEVGSFAELMKRNGAFAEFLRNYLTEEMKDDESNLDDPDGRFHFTTLRYLYCSLHLVLQYSLVLFFCFVAHSYFSCYDFLFLVVFSAFVSLIYNFLFEDYTNKKKCLHIKLYI